MPYVQVDIDQLKAIKQAIESDIESSCYDVPDYTDSDQMIYYAHRATALDTIKSTLKREGLDL